MWLAGGCLLGAALCLLASLWGLGGQGGPGAEEQQWDPGGSVSSCPFCCSASFLLFSSSRFLETKPKKRKKSKRPHLLESHQGGLKCREELPQHRMDTGALSEMGFFPKCNSNHLLGPGHHRLLHHLTRLLVCEIQTLLFLELTETHPFLSCSGKHSRMPLRTTVTGTASNLFYL